MAEVLCSSAISGGLIGSGQLIYTTSIVGRLQLPANLPISAITPVLLRVHIGHVENVKEGQTACSPIKIAQHRSMRTRHSQLARITRVPGMDSELRQSSVRAFRNATSNGKELTPEDYKVAVLELLGYKPSKYELSSVWTSCLGKAANQEGAGLGLETFVSIMIERLKQKDENELIREVFVALDVCQRGFLTERECLAAFEQVAPQLRKEAARQMFEEVDSDGDGRVSYRDFEIMMKSVTIPKIQ